MSAEELLMKVRAANPGVRYAMYATGSAVGEWIPGLGRFAPVYEAALGGRWVCTIQDGMIRETLANGESAYDPARWVE